MKKFVFGVIVGVAITASGSVFADDVIERVDAYINKAIPVTVDGKTVSLDKPVAVIDGSSYLPVKALGEVIGKEVNWNDATKTIELKSVIDPSKGVPTKDGSTGSTSTNNGSNTTTENPVTYVKWKEIVANGVVINDNGKEYILTSTVINGKPVINFGDQKYTALTNVDQYYNRATDEAFYSTQFLGQFLSSQFLGSLQKYNIDTNTGVIQPTN